MLDGVEGTGCKASSYPDRWFSESLVELLSIKEKRGCNCYHSLTL